MQSTPDLSLVRLYLEILCKVVEYSKFCRTNKDFFLKLPGGRGAVLGPRIFYEVRVLFLTNLTARYVNGTRIHKSQESVRTGGGCNWLS